MASRLHNKIVRNTGKKQKPVPVKIVSDYPAVPSVKEDNSWRVRNDLDTLRQAEEIRKDRARMAAVKKEAAAQIKALSTVGKR